MVGWRLARTHNNANANASASAKLLWVTHNK
jgi:hypothetical protein